MLHTTFRKARDANACKESYRKYAKSVGGVKKYGEDTPIPLDSILEVCGFGDALWCLRATLENCDREARLFACACAKRVLPLFEKENPEDKRPREAIKVARRFAEGKATREELAAARAAAWAAAWAAAGDAAWDAAGDAAGDTAGVAAWAAAGEWQKQRFLELLRR